MRFGTILQLLVLTSVSGCATSGSLLEPDPGPARIEYYGEGGIAAMRFAHWVDSATGVVSAGAPELCATLKRECVFPAVVYRTLTAAEVDALFREAASREFAALKAEYVPANICCDRREHFLLVRANGSRRTVRWYDGVDMPPVLLRVSQVMFQMTR